MPIYFLLNLFNLQLFEIQLHLLAILCAYEISRRLIASLENRHILNFNAKLAGCVAALRPSVLISIAIVERAFGGSKAKKLRAVLPERALNGENDAVTPVMYLVSILADYTQMFEVLCM